MYSFAQLLLAQMLLGLQGFYLFLKLLLLYLLLLLQCFYLFVQFLLPCYSIRSLGLHRAGVGGEFHVGPCGSAVLLHMVLQSVRV